nr:hypothetical protein [Desulfonatronospira thiodismutans]
MGKAGFTSGPLFEKIDSFLILLKGMSAKFKVHDSKAFRRLSGGRCYEVNAFFLQGLMICIGFIAIVSQFHIRLKDLLLSGIY